MMSPLLPIFHHFAEISCREIEDIILNAIFLESTQVLLHDCDSASDAVGRSTPSSHRHEVLLVAICNYVNILPFV